MGDKGGGVNHIHISQKMSNVIYGRLGGPLHMLKSLLMHKNINQCTNIVTSIYITPILVLFLCTDVTKVHL